MSSFTFFCRRFLPRKQTVTHSKILLLFSFFCATFKNEEGNRMRPIAAMEQCFQTKKSKFSVLFLSCFRTFYFTNYFNSQFAFFPSVFFSKQFSRRREVIATIWQAYRLPLLSGNRFPAKDHHGRRPSLVAAEVTFPS